MPGILIDVRTVLAYNFVNAVVETMKEASQLRLQVFLCHASEDKQMVHEIYDRLSSENWINPWLDTKVLLPCDHWKTVIKRAIAQADNIIIFISNISTTRDGFVQREMSLAWELSLQKPRGTIFLIPVRLEDCRVPDDLESV